jgi:arylsulfatase A-like enzyme
MMAGQRQVALIAALASAATAADAGLAGSRPNIVFILSDDLGYGDYSASWDGVQPGMKLNATRIPTPNVERMAKNGMKFQRGYSGQVCAPSRTMLMLGKHLGHTTIRGNDGAYTPLLKSDVTVAKVLKDAGYVTMLSGKWGLGNFGTTGYPNAQGFDKFVGQDTQVGCHDWYPLEVCNDTGTTEGVAHSTINTKADLAFIPCLGPHSTCTWANDLDRTEGVKFITESHAAKKPFFLYLASTTPHAGNLAGTGPKPALYSAYNPVPYPYNTKFADANASSPTPELWSAKEKLFASAVWAEDVMVGAVLDTLESLSIEKETVVFFSGDNVTQCR